MHKMINDRLTRFSGVSRQAKQRLVALFFAVMNVGFGFIRPHLSAITAKLTSPHSVALRQRFTLAAFVVVFFASSMIPVLSPWVAEAHAAQKVLAPPDPLETQKQNLVPAKTEGITAAAKATAVPAKDPVTAYQEEQAALEGKPKSPTKIIKENEIKEKRTAFSNTYLNTEGGETERIYTEPVNYRPNDGKDSWTPLTSEIKEDTAYNKSESSKESLLSRVLPGKPFIKKGLRLDSGFLRGTFRSLNESDGLTIGSDGKANFGVTFLGANPKANPELRTFEDGQQYILYKNAWKNADVYYEQRGTGLKETIVLNAKDVPTTFGFRFSDAKLSFGVDEHGKQDGTVVAELKDGSKVVLPELSIVSKVTGPFENPKMHYEIDGSVVRVVIDAAWFASLPDSAFPIIVDPTYDWRGVSTGIPGGDYGQFTAYKSNGYVCGSSSCDIYTGSLNDGGLKSWRTMMRLPLANVYGQSVSWANIYTERVNRPNVWNGFNGNRPYEITWAHCFGFHCFSGAPRATTWLDWAGNFDATALMQWIAANNVGDGWLMIKAVNEGDINSFKSFAGSRTFLDVNFRHWNQQTGLPTLAEPAQNAIVPVSRPTLKINPVSDPDGDLVRYAFHLLDSKGKIVAHSGELDTTWWTIPDDILIDGETYSWRAFVMERNAGNPGVVESGWRQQPEVRSFKFDLRTGKDKTQTYDEVGPLSVSLNRGNGYTGASSHSMSALGGSIGVGLDYNTPNLSQYGLTGYYYNETGSGRLHAITVKDPNIDMVWGGGSPYPGTMQADNFTINWQGYFIAPYDGSYTFGADRDDRVSMSITHDGIVDQQFDYGCCGTTMATKSVTLKRGEAYPVSIWYFEATGYAAAHLKVRLPNGSEVTVPSEWLRTLPDTAALLNKGLTARFYETDSSNTNFVINDQTPLVFSTRVPDVNRDWGTGSLLPYSVGPYSDFMIANYSGFLTVPTDGKYQIGGGSDDGMRIRLGGKEVANSWSPHGYLEVWSPEIDLKAGQIIPISIDYFEYNGAARATLQWRSSTNAVNTGVIPGQYLSTAPKVVPQGWALGADPDGDIPYEVLQTKSSGNADLIDSDGFVHTYTWTGSGFKPPVNEDGYLTRNSDGTFTLADVDGRVYNFSVDGLVVQVTSPLDDRKPAALQYEYRDTSTSVYGSLPKLNAIRDGVDPANRYGQLYYWGEQGSDTVCSVPAGYETPMPGYLCAFKTFPDNQVTTFAYKGYQLARVQLPGNQAFDYAYDASNRLTQVRDSLANDAVSAGVRIADGTETTQITYDDLGRIAKVLAPAPFGATVPAGQPNTRQERKLEYGYQDTKTQLTGATSPMGYQEYIEYDNLLRTTKSCDKSGLCTTSEYDPLKDLLLSTTDASGLKSTSLYDGDDRLTDSYGPAPMAWFGSDRRPTSAYVNQIPHSQTNYDEGMVGAAVAWYNVKGSSLFGAPKLHTTGTISSDPTWLKVDGNTVPFTPDAGMDGYGLSATGKVRFPAAGTYTMRLWHDDGARLWIDDKLVIDDWAHRSEGGATSAPSATFTAEAGKLYRFRYDYLHVGTPGWFELWVNGPGITSVNADLGISRWNFLSPQYNLTTSTKVYDSQTGDVTNTTNYGSKPELGQIVGTTEDSGAGGQNLTTGFTYEPYQTGSLMRQTSKTLPGGNTFTYNYYGATETRANPCVAGSAAVSQAGMAKGKTEPDPDGTGPQTGRVTENVYDATGRVVATHFNNDSWTCTAYDTRGRVTTTSIPALGQWQPARTITNNYAVNGNPMTVSSTDTNGTISTTTDLLGRTLSYTDSRNNTTTSIYDAQGHLISRDGPLGHEEFTYDAYDRLVDQKLDGAVYAHVTYDAYSRIDNVTYPAADQLKVTLGRDATGRLNSNSYQGTTATTTGTTTGPGPNLIVNPSLETASPGDPNTPTQWHSDTWSDNTPVFSYLNEGHTGSRSVKTEVTNYTSGDAKWYFDPVAVSGDTNYTFTDWYKSNTNAPVIVQFTHQDGSRTYGWVGTTAPTSSWTQASYSFTTPATTARVSVFHLVDSVGWLAVDDADLHVTNQTTTTTVPGGVGTIASDQVTRSVTGDILSGTENGLAKNYAYDKAGRLTAATIGSNTYAYDYSAPTVAQCGQASANLGAHKNSNRTRMTINGAATTYCYNYADQLISSSDQNVSNPVYDPHGNVIQMGASSKPLRTPVDASDRSRGIEQYDNNGNGLAYYYERDVQNRIVSRGKMNIANWDWIWVSGSYYGFTGGGDTPDFVRDDNGNITEKYLQLPGSVLLTIRPSESDTNKQKTYSLPNIHGDIFATTNAGGMLTSTHVTGPFGEQVTGQTNPGNAVLGATYSYVGQHEKLTETDFTVQLVQMGARVYVPSMGRFLQVDPVEGGTDNSYAYVSDPVNDFDLEGTFGFKTLLKVVAKVASHASWIPGPVGMVASGVAVAAYIGTGNYAAAGEAAVGLIPGGKMMSGLVKGSRWAVNATRGKAAESVALGMAKLAHPLCKVTKGTPIATTAGKRIPDIKLRGRISGNIRGYIEVKAGRAIYNNAQKAKDALLKAKTTLKRYRWM